jgi:probable addiction module antidote protein
VVGTNARRIKTFREQRNFGRSIRVPTKSYQDELFEQLQDLGEAAAYLTECFEDSEEVFLLGLRNVVEAHGGVGSLAKSTDLNRENLYRLLSEMGNPKLSSLAIILEALGIRLEFAPKKGRNAA